MVIADLYGIGNLVMLRCEKAKDLIPRQTVGVFVELSKTTLVFMKKVGQ